MLFRSQICARWPGGRRDSKRSAPRRGTGSENIVKAFIVDHYGKKDGARIGEMPDPEMRQDNVLSQRRSVTRDRSPHRFWDYSASRGSGLSIRLDQRGYGLPRKRTCKRQGCREGEIKNSLASIEAERQQPVSLAGVGDSREGHRQGLCAQ